jgi:hypothetical protein
MDSNASRTTGLGVKVTLAHRHYGVHTTRAETEIPGVFGDYATPKPGADRDDFVIDEDKILAALPVGFLPVAPSRILLAVEDETGGTGQRGLARFRNWAKYFDAYCLNLIKDAERDGQADG